jgi:hypothetical protein
MKKAEMIAQRGIDAYNKQLSQSRVSAKTWGKEHPKEVKARNNQYHRKNGVHYHKTLQYNRTGVRPARHRVRSKHQYLYLPYKNIIAPSSQIHHQWIPDTANCTGIALVEADQHMHGFIDVIEILSGKITLFTEEEVRKEE